MNEDINDDEESFVKWFESIRGVKGLKDLYSGDEEEVLEWGHRIWDLINDLGYDRRRYEHAEKLLNPLIPTTVDVHVWEAVARGENVLLPVSTQYGPVSARLKASSTKGHKSAARVQEKDSAAKQNEPPRQTFDRRGKAAVAAAAKVHRLESELAEARAEQSALENELKAFATSCLFTAMRKATASVFAMGPAWTLLRSIRGETGVEETADDRTRETHRVLVVLHALCGHLPFEQELKRTILEVCNKWTDEAAKRGKMETEFDGPYDYELILSGLGWPETPEPPRGWYSRRDGEEQ